MAKPALAKSVSEDGVADRSSGPAGLTFGILPRLLGYHLRRTQVAVFKHFARTVAVVEDMTPGLFGMLQVIAANPGLSQSRLAEAMGVDRSTVVKVVRQLDRRGLIERTASPLDGRSYCLRPSPRGRIAIERMETNILRHEQDIASGLTADEQQTLVRLLTRVYQQSHGAD